MLTFHFRHFRRHYRFRHLLIITPERDFATLRCQAPFSLFRCHAAAMPPRHDAYGAAAIADLIDSRAFRHDAYALL